MLFNLIKCVLLISLIICGFCDKDPFFINKCCPEGQRFDIESQCQDIDFENGTEVANFSWFPIELIVNSTTRKIHQHERDRYLSILLDHYQVQQWEIPQCEAEDITTQFLIFAIDYDSPEFFHFLMDDDMTMRLHVTKPESLHDPVKDFVEFRKITSDAEAAILSKEPIRTFPMEDACVDTGEYYGFVYYQLVYCPCRSMTCIRKCCKDGEFWDDSVHECLEMSTSTIQVRDWRPRKLQNNDYYLLTNTSPNCERVVQLKEEVDTNHCQSQIDPPKEFVVLQNGSVQVGSAAYSRELYCGTVTWHKGGEVYEQNIILCDVMSSAPKPKPLKFVVYGSLLIIAGICLFATVAISLYLPEMRRRVHNKIALSHNSSLMVACFSEAISQISPRREDKSCIFINLLMQFSFLGSFFWLNVMCIDISATFSSTFGAARRTGSKRFIYYCIYSWGMTALISIVTIAMEFAHELPSWILRPGFTCTTHCSFNTENAAILIYFYGPMCVLLVFNLILFVITTIKIMSVQRQTAMLHQTDSNKIRGTTYRKSDQQRFVLYVRLFLLMGLTWATEIINWAIGGPGYYWYILDIINLLRGVFIFVLFICKKTVLMSLKDKVLGVSRKYSESSSNTNRESRFKYRPKSRVAPANDIEFRENVKERSSEVTPKDESESSI